MIKKSNLFNKEIKIHTLNLNYTKNTVNIHNYNSFLKIIRD